MSTNLPAKISDTPAPPYYAVIFTSLRTEGDNGYDETAKRMEEFPSQYPVSWNRKRTKRTGNNCVLLEQSGSYPKLEKKYRAYDGAAKRKSRMVF
jgi:hypothetical protein